MVTPGTHVAIIPPQKYRSLSDLRAPTCNAPDRTIVTIAGDRLQDCSAWDLYAPYSPNAVQKSSCCGRSALPACGCKISVRYPFYYPRRFRVVVSKNKEARQVVILTGFTFMPEEGIEPSLPCENRILNPARLPIPPLRRLGRPIEAIHSAEGQLQAVL